MNIETANRLLQYRKENNLSQEELAEKIGVSRQAVSKWERAEASPDTDNLIRLAEIYGVSLDEMLTGKKTQAEPEPEPQPEPQTDESNTGSFEPDPDTNYTQYDKVSFKKGIHVESKDGDKVHISFKDGVNVYEAGTESMLTKKAKPAFIPTKTVTSWSMMKLKTLTGRTRTTGC